MADAEPVGQAFSAPAGAEVAPATGIRRRLTPHVSQAISAAHGALAGAVSG